MKRRALLFTLLVLLLIVGIPTILLARELRQESLNRALIAAIKRQNIPYALNLLQQGANANTRDLGNSPPSLKQICSDTLNKILHRPARAATDYYPTALI